MLMGRDYVKVGEAARVLGVSEQTLRNWHGRGKLVPVRHPINGYRMYRVSDVHALLQTFKQGALDFESVTEAPAQGMVSEAPAQGKALDALEGLLPCHWSRDVALDPKHRPQHWHQTSSTIRRDWRKFPQEAHVLDASGTKYRRLTVDEIAILQGFDPGVVQGVDLTERERIASLGDAVPPPLARALVAGISEHVEWKCRTAVEICAGTGGLAEGAAAAGLEHLLLADHSDVCGTLLRRDRHWHADRVLVGDVREIDFAKFEGRVGLFSGGPPCQPWSQSGLRQGHEDQRDLLGELHELVAVIKPEAFLFENVPGLASGQNAAYLKALLDRLRRPGHELRYGVLVAQFNAADFGVAQSRERVFILGLRDKPASIVSRCFDSVEARRTHQRPGGSNRSLPPWLTVGDVLERRPDPGGWRKWIGQ
jgi:site-specific DNA-cytosine methylase